MGDETGQATIEWTGLLLLVAIALAAAVSLVPVVDGRSLGALISSRIVCAVEGDCGSGSDAIAGAYGEEDAQLVRRFAPGLVYEPGERSLPVDFRQCRAVRCAAAPDDRDLDTRRTDAGLPATMFTRVLRRGETRYVQYWLYYPDSNSVVGPAGAPWNKAARAVGPHVPKVGGDVYHRDDWEGVQVKVTANGRVSVRATSHGHYQWCKESRCRDRWGPYDGWSRVSRDSHAGHVPLRRDPPQHRSAHRVPYARSGPLVGYNPDSVGYSPQTPGVDLRERTTAGAGVRLIPLETLDKRSYRRLHENISPPWEKAVYNDPESGES